MEVASEIIGAARRSDYENDPEWTNKIFDMLLARLWVHGYMTAVQRELRSVLTMDSEDYHLEFCSALEHAFYHIKGKWSDTL